MPVLNANIRALNSYSGSLKLHNLYFIAYTFLPEQQKYCTKPTQLFLFYLLIDIHILSTLFTFDLEINKEGMNEKETTGCPFFPFLLHHFTVKVVG